MLNGVSNSMDFKLLVLEASHSYMVYMNLVPNAKLLKWADILLQAGAILDIDASTSYGSDADKLLRQQQLNLMRRDLRALIYEPIFAMANAIRIKLHHPDMAQKDKEFITLKQQLDSTCIKSEDRKVDPDVDVIALKNSLISAMNQAFAYLNKIQEHQYPKIPTRKEMIEVK